MIRLNVFLSCFLLATVMIRLNVFLSCFLLATRQTLEYAYLLHFRYQTCVSGISRVQAV